MPRFEAVLGFNTKQWWVYDNKLDLYIDPPAEVLNSLPDWREDCQKAEEEFQKVIDSKPEWLNDTHYWFSGEDFEI